MKDIIWTIIVVWFIYKIVDVLRGLTSKNSNTRANTKSQGQTTNSHTTTRPEKDIKKAVKNNLNNEGEYVDFEEVK
jgi:hypothetical protein